MKEEINEFQVVASIRKHFRTSDVMLVIRGIPL